MKALRIITLHLAYGGIEKAVCQMASMFAEKYDVEIISVYDMPDAPAFPIDPRVKIRYLLDETPNREEWRECKSRGDVFGLARESVKALRILHDKKKAVIGAISEINDGIIITTRPEHNVLLSKYGRPGVYKLGQLHQDHCFDKKLLDSFKNEYGGLDVFILLTPGLAGEVREIMRENKHTRVTAIPNFLEHYPEKLPERRENTIVAVGRLVEGKGMDRLIRIFAAVHEKAPDWSLRIIGEGEERQSLEALRDELGLSDCVSLTGMLSAPEVEREMLSASIYASASKSEGLSFALVEAMSCGLAPVAYDVRVGPAATITDGVNGYLVPDGDADAFAERLLRLINEPKLMAKLSRAALRRAEDFSRENVSRQWFRLLEDRDCICE